MRSLQLTIAVLALVATAAGQTCWSNTLCDFDEQSDIKVPIDKATYQTLDEQMTQCQALCVANTDITCTHFSIFAVGRGVNCYLLTDCEDSSTPECLALDLCNSGPADCTVNQNCPQLTAPVAGTDYIPWQCDGGVNPYTQQIPEDTNCFLSCKSWISKDGAPAQITSSCVAGPTEGEWTPSEIEGGLAAGDVPPLANVDLTTVKPDGANLACSCAIQPMSLNIGTELAEILIAYDPNELPGTDFICSGDSGKTDGNCATNPKCYLTGAEGAKVFELDPAYTCRLFCDSYHIATMTCDGVWTGEPELGAWCYAEPTAADNVNP